MKLENQLHARNKSNRERNWSSLTVGQVVISQQFHCTHSATWIRGNTPSQPTWEVGDGLSSRGKNCVHTIEISAEGESCLQTGSAPDMVFSVSVDYLTWFRDTCSYFPSLTVTVRLTSPQTSSPQTWWSRWSVTWRRPSDSTSPTWRSTPPWETTTTGRRYRCSRRKDDVNRAKIQKCLFIDTQQISLTHLGGWVKFWDTKN